MPHLALVAGGGRPERDNPCEIGEEEVEVLLDEEAERVERQRSGRQLAKERVLVQAFPEIGALSAERLAEGHAICALSPEPLTS